MDIDGWARIGGEPNTGSRTGARGSKTRQPRQPAKEPRAKERRRRCEEANLTPNQEGVGARFLKGRRTVFLPYCAGKEVGNDCWGLPPLAQIWPIERPCHSAWRHCADGGQPLARVLAVAGLLGASLTPRDSLQPGVPWHRLPHAYAHAHACCQKRMVPNTVRCSP